MNRMIRFHLFVFPGAPLCLAVLMLLVACASTAATSDLPTATHTPDATSLPAVFFFRQKKDPNIYTQALMEGELVLVDDCLRIGGADGHVPIWPWDFALETGDSDVRVVGADGRVVAEIGDRLRISGGEVPAMPVVEDAARPLLANCPGPYWAVGNEIERVALMASPTSAEPPVSCSAEPSRKTTSPIPTGTPPPSPTAAGLGVSVGTEPGLPQILSEGTLDCVPTGSLAHCVDDVLSIEFDIPASWGSVKTKLLAGGYTGHAYYYYFGGKTDAGPKDLVAGGLSANYSSGGRGAMPTDFWGYEDADWHRASACAGSGDRFGNSYPICREVSDHVAWMIRFPSAEVLCPHGFYAWETTPTFRIEVNLPDNATINGFVFEASFFSRAFADRIEAREQACVCFTMLRLVRSDIPPQPLLGDLVARFTALWPYPFTRSPGVEHQGSRYRALAAVLGRGVPPQDARVGTRRSIGSSARSGSLSWPGTWRSTWVRPTRWSTHGVRASC